MSILAISLFATLVVFATSTALFRWGADRYDDVVVSLIGVVGRNGQTFTSPTSKTNVKP